LKWVAVKASQFGRNSASRAVSPRAGILLAGKPHVRRN
jgi:hypothetical protein